MGTLIETFTFDRNTFRRTIEQSADSVAQHIDKVTKNAALDKTASNIIGALASYMGVFRKQEGNFVKSRVADVFLDLYARNRADSWRWLVARSLWRFVVPNGTNCRVNATASTLQTTFAFFPSLLQLLTHLSAEDGQKRFLYFEELCKLLNDDANWSLSGAELFAKVLVNRRAASSGFGSSRGFNDDLDRDYIIPRDNFNGLFTKAFAQTGLFENWTIGGKVVAVALRADLDPVLQRRMRFILDNPPSWNSGTTAWPDYLDLQTKDLPKEVTANRVEVDEVNVDVEDLKELAPAFKQSLDAAGLRISDQTLRRFLAALVPKRFLILTGLSGSGKTKLAQAFARWITPRRAFGDPFLPGAQIEADRVTYYVKRSDSIAVELWNSQDDNDAIKVALPRELIAEWAAYIRDNDLPETTPPRTIREGVKESSKFSNHLHDFESHLKAAAFALLSSTAAVVTDKCYEILPVGADWTSSDSILGYPNGLDKEVYVSRPSLDLFRRAMKPENAEIPYFLVLDEMNLSHVERYFADILSAIESDESIPLYDGDARSANGAEVPRSLPLPNNVFIIGTVNVDETTYMFSPKVLDRANVIEFRIDTGEFDQFLKDRRSPRLELLDGKGQAFGSHFVQAANNDTWEVPADVRPKMDDEFRLLFGVFQRHGMEFGYRVINETAKFIRYYREFCPDDVDDWFLQAVDAVVVQKLLPKLHGSRSKIEGVLWELAWACGAARTAARGSDFIKQLEVAGTTKDESTYNPEVVHDNVLAGERSQPALVPSYPLSFDKVIRIYRKLVRDQFASFAEA